MNNNVHTAFVWWIRPLFMFLCCYVRLLITEGSHFTTKSQGRFTGRGGQIGRAKTSKRSVVRFLGESNQFYGQTNDLPNWSLSFSSLALSTTRAGLSARIIWLSWILGHNTSLSVPDICQWGSIIEFPRVRTLKSRNPSWYDLRCCQDKIPTSAKADSF